LKKYESVEEIIEDYFETRLKAYHARKEYMIVSIQKELILLSNKAKYISENLEGTIDLRKKKREQVVALLQEKGYDQIDGDEEYRYLTKMPMDSVTEENIERLFKEKGNKEKDLEKIQSTSVQEMWLHELDNLKTVYMEYKEERERLLQGDDNAKPQKKKVVKSSQNKVVVNKAKKTPLLVEA
jgi:DNA topoisomerase-2